MNLLKPAPRSIHVIILNFANLMSKKGLDSKSWCLDLITPIFKEGDKESPKNYRGLSIMNTLLKLVCTMMSKRLQRYLAEKNIIVQEQIGIKPNARTSDRIFTVKASVNKYVNDQKNKTLYTCFIDFKKAFPKNYYIILYYYILYIIYYYIIILYYIIHTNYLKEI